MKKSNIYEIFTSPIYIIIFLSVVLSLVLISPNINYDESIWRYIGWLWSDRGIPPYTGAIENKTPGVFIIFAISEYISNGNLFFVRALGAFSVLGASYLIYLIGKILHSKLSGVFCMYIYGLTMGWYILDGFSLSHTETFMVFFTILSFYLIIKAKHSKKIIIWILLSGVSLGFAIIFKQIALTTLIALYFCLWNFTLKGSLLLKKIKAFLFLSLGVGSVIILSYIVLYFYQVPFATYIEEAWLILLNPGSSLLDLELRFNRFYKLFFCTRMLVFYPFVLLLFSTKTIYKSNYFKILIFWLLADFIGVNASGYFYGHQLKQMLPALILIISILLSEFVNQSKFGHKNFKEKSIIAIIIVTIIFMPYKQVLKNMKETFFDKTTTLSMSKEIGYLVNSNSNEDDFVYALGNDDEKLLHSLVESKRISSSKYFNPIFITSEKEKKAVYLDLVSKTPMFIFKDNTADKDISEIYGAAINDFVKENYLLFQEKHKIKILKHK